MARGKVSLTRGIHCCPYFLFILPDQRPYIAKNMCIYTYIYIYIYMHTHTHTHTHISDCLEILYELPLLPNNTASETLLHKSGAVRSVDWMFIIGAPAWRRLGEYITLGKTFYNLLVKPQAVAALVISTFSSLSHFSRRPLLEIYNYTMY